MPELAPATVRERLAPTRPRPREELDEVVPAGGRGGSHVDAHDGIVRRSASRAEEQDSVSVEFRDPDGDVVDVSWEPE
jgi:hypothetical protein